MIYLSRHSNVPSKVGMTEAITAVESVSTLMPGTKYEASRIAAVMINHLVMINIITLPHYLVTLAKSKRSSARSVSGTET